MRNIIMGIAVGAGLMFAGVAVASVGGLVVGTGVQVGSDSSVVYKVSDTAKGGATCYVLRDNRGSGAGIGISCVK